MRIENDRVVLDSGESASLKDVQAIIGRLSELGVQPKCGTIKTNERTLDIFNGGHETRVRERTWISCKKGVQVGCQWFTWAQVAEASDKIAEYHRRLDAGDDLF